MQEAQRLLMEASGVVRLQVYRRHQSAATATELEQEPDGADGSTAGEHPALKSKDL